MTVSYRFTRPLTIERKNYMKGKVAAAAASIDALRKGECSRDDVPFARL